MDVAEWRKRASSFGAAAALYDSVRPTYPAEALRWALEPLGSGAHRVADIGAGTGLLTRVVAALGYETVAVEPDDLMRGRLAATTPGVTALPGRAEELPFPDAGLDGAVAGQAYHWFDRSRAHAELARVIRSGGVFVAIWNERDKSIPWMIEYSDIVAGGRSSEAGGRTVPPTFGDWFGPTERRDFHHTVRATPASLMALMQSRSTYLTATAARQSAMEAAVRDFVASHPDLAGATEIALPYVTEVNRGIRA